MVDLMDNQTNELEETLMEKYGPLISGAELSSVLGFKTYHGFRQSVRRSKISIPLFKIPNRRGKFALTKDVAGWLVQQKINSITEKTEKRECK